MRTIGDTPSLADLKARLDPLTPIFVLVDPLLGEPLPIADSGDADLTALRDEQWQRPTTIITLNPKVPLPLHQHPYLVSLSSINDPRLEWTLAMAEAEHAEALAAGLDGDGGGAHRFGAWIQSSLDVTIVAKQLASMMRVNTDAVTQATYLRLADQRVYALLRHVVGDERVASQLGRIQSWTYLDMLGQLCTVRSAAEESRALRMDRNEWALLEQGQPLHRTLTMWLGALAKMVSDPMPARPASQLYADAQAAVTEASAAAQQWPHRFTHGSDQIFWAVLLLLYPHQRNHRGVSELMQRSGTPDNPPEPVRYMYTEIRALLAGHSSVRADLKTNRALL